MKEDELEELAVPHALILDDPSTPTIADFGLYSLLATLCHARGVSKCRSLIKDPRTTGSTLANVSPMTGGVLRR